MNIHPNDKFHGKSFHHLPISKYISSISFISFISSFILSSILKKSNKNHPPAFFGCLFTLFFRMVYGLVATFFCYACCELIKHLGLDDALDVWGVHGMGGWIGSILWLGETRYTVFAICAIGSKLNSHYFPIIGDKLINPIP